MGLLKTRKVEKSYDLFSRFSHYNPGFGGMLAFLLLALAGALLGNGLMALLGLILPPETLAPYATFITYPLMFIPPMLYASTKSMLHELDVESNPLDRKISSKGGFWILALPVSVATLALAFMVEPVNTLLPEMPAEIKAMMKGLMDGPILTTLISVALFAPFFEEWLCRGMVLRGLLTRMRPSMAIAISALFFAVLHMNPWQALPAFIIGLLLGWVYYRTGSLKLTMLMHCVNNTVSLLLSKVDAFKAADTFMDVFSPALYWSIFVACLLLLAASLLFLNKKAVSPEETLPELNNTTD